MRLVIGYNKCRRTGQCSYLHPELFKADEVGAPVVLVERPGEALALPPRRQSSSIRVEQSFY